MKKSSILSILAIFCMIFASSCGSSSNGSNETAENQAVNVDQVLADADNMIGDTIVIEGVCSHLCAHGAMKAFVKGSADNIMIRCEAMPLMGEPFAKAAIRRPIQVKGVVKEERIDEEAIQKMIQANEAQQQALKEKGEEGGEEAESGCATERTAKGQQNLTTFEERIADYRAKIAARNEKEGKPYLSYYYLEAISYEILPE